MSGQGNQWMHHWMILQVMNEWVNVWKIAVSEWTNNIEIQVRNKHAIKWEVKEGMDKWINWINELMRSEQINKPSDLAMNE